MTTAAAAAALHLDVYSSSCTSGTPPGGHGPCRNFSTIPTYNDPLTSTIAMCRGGRMLKTTHRRRPGMREHPHVTCASGSSSSSSSSTVYCSAPERYVPPPHQADHPGQHWSAPRSPGPRQQWLWTHSRAHPHQEVAASFGSKAAAGAAAVSAPPSSLFCRACAALAVLGFRHKGHNTTESN
jgi:hypothetical protein